MPRLTISILHLLPASDALEQMYHVINSLQFNEKHISSVTQKWNNNEGEFTLTFKKCTLTGSIQVQEQLVVIKANLPIKLYFYRAYIKKLIEERAVRFLSNQK